MGDFVNDDALGYARQVVSAGDQVAVRCPGFVGEWLSFQFESHGGWNAREGGGAIGNASLGELGLWKRQAN